IGLWALVDDGAGFHEVLDGLLAQGLSALSGFVLVGSEEEGTTKVLLRGEGVRAEIEGAEESASLEGTAGATWVERTLRGVTSLRVDLGPVEHGPDLRIDQGLVRVATVQRPAASDPVAAPPPAARATDVPAGDVG